MDELRGGVSTVMIRYLGLYSRRKFSVQRLFNSSSHIIVVVLSGRVKDNLGSQKVQSDLEIYKTLTSCFYTGSLCMAYVLGMARVCL